MKNVLTKSRFKFLSLFSKIHTLQIDKLKYVRDLIRHVRLLSPLHNTYQIFPHNTIFVEMLTYCSITPSTKFQYHVNVALCICVSIDHVFFSSSLKRLVFKSYPYIVCVIGFFYVLSNDFRFSSFFFFFETIAYRRSIFDPIRDKPFEIVNKSYTRQSFFFNNNIRIL